MTIPIDRFDLDGFLGQLEQLLLHLGRSGSGMTCGAHAGMVQKVFDCDTIREFPVHWNAKGIAEHLSTDDASVFVAFAIGNPGGSYAECTDGIRRRLLARDGLRLNASDFLGYLVTRRADRLVFSSAIYCADCGPRRGPRVFEARQGNRYWKAMQSFAGRFERRKIA